MDYNWEAVYKDGKVFKQFEGNKENRFGDINMPNLKVFKLVGTSATYSVNLENGEFDLNGVKSIPIANAGKYELVYKRRNTVNFGPTMKNLGSSTIFIAGYKAGNKIKVMHLYQSEGKYKADIKDTA